MWLFGYRGCAEREIDIKHHFLIDYLGCRESEIDIYSRSKERELGI